MNYLDVLDEIKSHVEELFRQGNDADLYYHNIAHTEAVVAHAGSLANYYQLGDKDRFTVAAACWFHDIGYLKSHDNHEAIGANAAAAFLESKSFPQEHIAEVEKCILATQMPQHPTNLLEEIVCDADLFHLGTEHFSETNKEMRKEVAGISGVPVDKTQWREDTIKFLQTHRFHTSFGREKLEPVKQQHLKSLIKKAGQNQLVPEKPASSVKKEVKTGKSDRPDKGIETMFRITSSNHQRLSDMADNKAHIMISTNSIILSVILSILLRKLEDNPHLILPTAILLIICVITMVFSILATRPAIPSGTFTKEDISVKKVNLLFFGNFYRMHLSDYEDGMHTLMEDKDYLYNSLIMDLHGQGVVLGRKYRLLRIAYNVFMFGIIGSVVAFIIAMAYIAL